MKCKISCSFGEIVDKVTILNIKLQKATQSDVLSNIRKELNIITSENPTVKKKDKLFEKLSIINQQLWNLEDMIREKSRKKEFDKQYIEYAESIHKTNDKRYLIKRQINEKYSSELKEEKIYNRTVIKLDKNDINRLEIGKKLWTDGHYQESYDCISKIMEKYKNYDTLDSFFVDLLFSFSNACSIFNSTNKYEQKIFSLMENIEDLPITTIQKNFCKSIFSTLCLKRKKYKKAGNYINHINYITGPNISYDNMSFFQQDDKLKTLLLYDGGGIGDKFMLSRFISIVCKTYKNNRVIFLVNDNILWFFQNIFDYSNLKIIPYSQKYMIRGFDYHCNLLSLIKYLNITYDTITYQNINDRLNVSVSDKCQRILDNIKPKTYILNWKGNKENLHEKHNRMMNLTNAIPLFKLKDVNWIVVTKDISSQERKLLKKYNIDYYGDTIDQNKAFYDTISIMRNVDGVVSTDTSLPHLSLTLGIKTFVLLTLGCEWRWSNEKTTRWYPDAILLKQTKFKIWKDVIDNLINHLSSPVS